MCKQVNRQETQVLSKPFLIYSAPMIRMCNRDVKSELPVRRRKRNELLRHSPDGTENRHNLHNTPSSPNTHSVKCL